MEGCHNHNGLGTLVLVELALWGGDILRHRGYALYFLGLHGSSLENQKKSLGAPLPVSEPALQAAPARLWKVFPPLPSPE